jgi:hypothetical protein
LNKDCAGYKRLLYGWLAAYGFRVLPAGYRNNGGNFNNRGNNANFWSSSAYSSTNAWRRNFNYDNATVNRNNTNRSNGYSVRCIRDSTNKTANMNVFICVFSLSLPCICACRFELTGRSWDGYGYSKRAF